MTSLMILLDKARVRYVGSRDDLGGIVSTLADTLTQRGARSFRRSILSAVEGDFTQGWSRLSIGIEELQGIYAEAFRRAGMAESTLLRGFEIDMTHPRVGSYLRRRSAKLVTGINSEVRIALRRALAEGTIEGLRPEELATRIRGIVGLSPRDAQAVDNLRAGMRAQGIPTGTANRRAKEYADRLLDARAMVIARTEVTDAIETGRQELWEQAVEAGLLARKHIWRIWVTAEDDRVCPICNPLDGARARLGGTFNKGGQSSPRPPAHPNCRCSVEYEIARFRIKKHYGPGPHPGTGTPQAVHGGGTQYANEGFTNQVVESSPKAFYSGFSQAREGPYGAFLSDFDEGSFEASNVRTFTAFDGKVGAALTEHDDGRVEVGSLFALPGTPDGAGRDLLRYLIHERGGNWLNNFDGVLTEFYIAEGFKVRTTDPFSDEFAPRNWDYDRFGRPDYLTMGTKAVTKHDTRGRDQGQRGLLESDEETHGGEGRRGAEGLPGSSVGDGQGIRVDRPEGGPLDKHAGPGPHPGTGTPQSVHGNRAGGQSGVPGLVEPASFDPGTSPLPDGHVRLYHYTAQPGVIDRIAVEGLKLETARGAEYGEPGLVWVSTRMPDEAYKDFVEFSLPFDDLKWRAGKVDVGSFADGTKLTADIVNEGSVYDLGFRVDIDPSSFIAIYKPWQFHYRYIMGDPTVQAEMNDPQWKDYWDSFADDPSYGPAVALARQKLGIKKHKADHDEKSHGNWARRVGRIPGGYRLTGAFDENALSDDGYVVFHGTSVENAEKIRTEGLQANPNVRSARWFMVTTSRRSAMRYSNGGAVLEFVIPLERLSGTLWAGKTDAFDDSAWQHALRVDRLDPKNIRLRKHYGPGPHPGTGTPQKIHGLPKGTYPIESTRGFSTTSKKAMEPYMFSFATTSGANYDSVVTRADEVGRFGGIVRIEGEIQADDGERVGGFLRQLDLRADTVFNANFNIDENFQGEGIGLTWLTLVENNLHRAGIERMNVAAVDVGRYAWAKYGYDWQKAGGNVGIQWWDQTIKRVNTSALFEIDLADKGTAAGHREWNTLVDRARSGDYPEPWEVAAIPEIGKFVFLTGDAWAGTKDTTIDYEAVEKADSAAYNRLLHQWVADGKANLIEQDDPSWFEAVANLE